MFEYGGVVLTGMGLLVELHKKFKDSTTWKTEDLHVDSDFFDLARQKGKISGEPNEFTWVPLPRVPTLELRGAHQTAYFYNEEKTTMYRIIQGDVILMKKLPPELVGDNDN